MDDAGLRGVVVGLQSGRDCTIEPDIEAILTIAPRPRGEHRAAFRLAGQKDAGQIDVDHPRHWSSGISSAASALAMPAR